MNGMGSDLYTILENNRHSMMVFTLLSVLERLNIKSARFIHQEEVHDYVERQMMAASWRMWK